MWWISLFLIPAAFGFFAIRTNRYPLKFMVTMSCILLLMVLTLGRAFSQAYFLLLALAASLLGDYFLSHKDRHRNAYLYGIVSFLAAHILYIVYALTNAVPGVMPIVITGVVLAGYLVYFFVRVSRRIPGELRLAALGYLVISCLSLGTALSIDMAALPKTLYVLGIVSIIVSDTMICEDDFVGNHKVTAGILPLYYLCHILLSIAVVIYIA